MNESHAEAAKQVSARDITYAAVAAAVIFVMTFVPKIPIPLGYAHLGDAVIFIAALFLPHRQAGLAASVGSALADFMGGFPIWIVPTFLIKYVMIECVFWLVRPDHTFWKLSSLRVFAGFLVSAIWMVVSYAVSGGLLYGSMAAGLAMVPGLVGEGIVNIIVAYAAGMVLVRAGFSLQGNKKDMKKV